MEDTEIKKKSSSKLWIYLVAVLLVALALVYLYLNVNFTATQEHHTEMLEHRLSSLEKQVSELSVSMKAYVEMAKDIQQKMEHEMIGSAVEGSQHQDVQTTKVLADLNAKVEQLESLLSAHQQQVSRIPETLGLFEKLHDKLQESRPFDKELLEAKVLFDPKDEDIQKRLEVLSSYSKTGVPSVEQLGLEFEDLSRELLTLSIPDDLPWYKKLGKRVTNLVIIRKHSELLDENASVEERIAAIHQLLVLGDIEGAMAELEALPKFNSEAFTQWVAVAGQRLYIEQSLPILEAHALAYLVKGSQPESPKGVKP